MSGKGKEAGGRGSILPKKTGAGHAVSDARPA